MKLKLLIMLLILTFLLNGCNKEENIYPLEFFTPKPLHVVVKIYFSPFKPLRCIRITHSTCIGAKVQGQMSNAFEILLFNILGNISYHLYLLI